MTDRTEPGEPSTARLYRAALGEASAGYYLPLFARFDTQGASGPVWNSAAAMLQLGWLLHHRLWMPLAAWSALVAGLALGVAGLWHFASSWPIGIKLGGSLSVLLVVGLVPGLWGSAWLHALVRKRVLKAVKLAPTVDAACEALSAEARDRQRRNTWGLAGLLCAVTLAGLLWKTVPWSSFVGGAEPSETGSAMASFVEGVADAQPATPVLASAEKEAVAAESVPPAASPTNEVKEVEDRVDGLSEAAPMVVSVSPGAGTPAPQRKDPEVKPVPPLKRSVGESPALQSAPLKPSETGVRAVPQPTEKVVSPIEKSPEPTVKSREVPEAELVNTVGAELVEQAAEVVKAVAPVASTGDLAPIRSRIQGFGVAVGMFAVSANAERVVAILSGAGLPVISDSVASARGELTRVRVGPFEREDQADTAAAKVKALGLDAKVYAP